jgi:hypothetical protein
VWVVCLAGLSFPIILYSSEARGYAPAMFFAVASFEILQRCWERCTPAKLLLFWTLLCLGVLSHFSFVIIVFALGGWSLLREKFTGASLGGTLVNAAKYYAVPAVFLAGVYLVFIRHIYIFGGPVYNWWEVLGATTAYALGFVDESGFRFVSVFSAVVLVGYGIWAQFRQRRAEWIFFVLVLAVSPSLVVMFLHPQYLYYRYFMVCFPFFYLLLAFVFARWFRSSRKMTKMFPVFLILAITTGHLIKVVNLLNFGRGNYRRTLYAMAAATPGTFIRVGSNNDWKNRLMLMFYARFLPPSKKLEYIPQEQRDRERPEWMVITSSDPTFRAYPDLEVGNIGKYNLFGVYPFAGYSGWSWFVYRRPAGANAGPPAGPQTNSLPVPGTNPPSP